MEIKTAKRIDSFLLSKQQEMTDLLVTLLQLESPTADKPRVDAVCDFIRSWCEQQGMNTTVYPSAVAGNSLKAVMNPRSPGRAIAFLGHMDTVHPVGCFGDDLARIDGDRIYGPGVHDMKGGLVVAMYVCLALKELGYKERPIMLLFTGDEETGHNRHSGGEQVYLQDPSRIAAALNFESGRIRGAIVVGRKMGLTYKMVVHGMAAHAGNEPQNGRNAILEAAHKIITIQAATDYEATTYSCGVIRGGTVPNVVPDCCEFEIDVRVCKKDAIADVQRFLRSVAENCTVVGTTADLIEPEILGGPMEPTAGNMALFEQFKAASDAFGAPVQAVCEVCGGASDASYTSAMGIPTICATGMRGEYFHTIREYALLSSIAERAAIITRMIIDFKEIEATEN